MLAGCRVPAAGAQVSAEQTEISRLRAELARVTMERDILGKAMALFRKRPEVKYAFGLPGLVPSEELV